MPLVAVKCRQWEFGFPKKPGIYPVLALTKRVGFAPDYAEWNGASWTRQTQAVEGIIAFLHVPCKTAEDALALAGRRE